MKPDCLLFLVLVLSIAWPTNAQDAAEPSGREIEQLRLELSREIDSQLEHEREILHRVFSGELKDHRRYLQELDERFYQRARVWVPVVSGATVFLIGAFLWVVGRNQKEAFETAQLKAEAAATELAKRRVDEIIVPERFVSQVEALSEAVLQETAKLRDTLVEDVTQKLEETRDRVLENRSAVIEKAVDDLVSELGEPGRLLQKVVSLQEELLTVRRQQGQIMARIIHLSSEIEVESIKQSVARRYEGKAELPSTARAIINIAEYMAKAVVGIR